MDEIFLNILANPLEPDRPPLKKVGNFLVCTKTGVGFPILNNIPQLLPENAIPAEELTKRLKDHE
jgi:uncharacterized protein YbaR (Trm112 family)